MMENKIELNESDYINAILNSDPKRIIVDFKPIYDVDFTFIDHFYFNDGVIVERSWIQPEKRKIGDFIEHKMSIIKPKTRKCVICLEQNQIRG